MTPLRPDEELIMAAFELSSASPEMWRKFLTAMDRYAESEMVRLITMSPDRLQVAQGRVQTCVEIGKLLHTCREVAAKIAANRK